MLPTSGYFRGVACPAHEKGQCNRPYCHFRHNPKKETSSAVPIQGTSAMNEDNDAISDQIKNKPSAPSVKSVSVEDSPSCSSTEASSILNSSISGTAQSELLQQLVSEAVKKVLIENPHLTSVGVDPSTLIAQTTAEVSPANSKSRKKSYCRPPDTPRYNPTPIKELNKRKRSGEFNEDSPSTAKAAKYVPASLTSSNMISDVSENKESGDSEATDFSSAEDEDIDKQNCDFDILEEVLAEHSQNNKIKVKKKKVKALGKLQYNLSNRDKKVDEASMISDARTLSDQDSNTCDAPKDNLKDYQEPVAGSYFLPPSPIFTSSSDGYAAYNSIVYAKSDTNEVEDSSELMSVEDSVVVKELEEKSKSSNTDKHLETSKLSDLKKGENCNSKKVTKGHALLPKFVHALGAPKMSRPNIRSWNPQSRNANAVDSTCKEGNDPLEAMLQQMDGVQDAQKEAGEISNTSSDTTRPATSSPKNSKKYKVDLDKEIKSLTNTSSVNNEEKDKVVDEEVHNPESDNIQKEKECEIDKKLVGTDIKLKIKEGGSDASDSIKESLKVVSPKIKQKQAIASSDSKSKEKSSDVKETIDKEKKSKDENSDADEKSSCDGRINAEESIDKEKKSHDESSDAEETIDKQMKSHDESETEQELKRKKRKRDHSSGSESHESYHRKKKKKSHKRRKKYKKRRRRRDSRSDSDDSDGESGKEDKDDEKVERDKSDLSEGDDKEESGKPKKHKKRKKKSRHRKKSKYKRSKSKLKKKDRSRSQSASLSSSQDRSRSTSQHRSRSSSRCRSRSSSRHRSRSSNRHRSRSLSRHRSRSLSRHRSRSLSQHKSRSLSRHKSRSLSRHRSRSLSKERSKSPKKNRHSSRSCSTSQESVNQTARHGKDSKSRSQTNDTVPNSKKDKEKNDQISMPMPIDPSKIKVEKEDIPKNTSVIVPDLSIVKTEKEDRPSLLSTSIKIEKPDNQSETIKSLDSTNKSKNSSNEKTKVSSITGTVEKSSSHHEERKELSNAGMKKESSSHQKLSKETNLQAKEKEHKRANIDKERRKSNSDRRNSTESISNRKSSRRESTEVKKGEKEQNSQKASVNERRGSTERNKGVTVSERRGSTEKNKGGNVSERRGSSEKNKDNTNMSKGSNQDSQPKGLSMFDMVMASIEPTKPRALKEISLFDNVSAVGYESSSDTTSPTSDLDEEYLSQVNKDQDKTSNHSSNDQKKSSSHSTSRDKHSSGSKPDKVKSPTKSEKDKHSAKSSTNHSKSKSHRESESDSKHAHSSSSKQKTSSHHSSSSSHKISSSSHKISSSSHKTSSNTSKELNNCNDNSSSVSSKTSHSSSSKNKEAKSSSHTGKQDDKNHSSRSNLDRKHSVGNHEKEKEYSSTTHKSREHGKKSSDKEKEHASGNHGKGKESSSKGGLDSEKDTYKSGSHEKLKESSKNRHDKEKERSNKKENMKDKLKMEENEVSSSSERELYAANDEEDDSSSPFPDLSVLDEIPQDDWEQMINTEGREDLKHLENLRTEEDFDLDDLDKDDPDIMEECLQMYNDYKPDPADVEQQSSSKKKMRVEPKEDELLPSKQRIARATSGGNMLATKPSAESKRRKKTPAQVMMERYQKLKEQQAELLKKLERQKQQLEEQSRGVSAAPSSSTVSSSTSSRSKHAVVSSPNVSSTTSSRSKVAPASSSTSLKSSPHSTSGAAPKRRMSHVPNVSSLLQERERIKNLPPPNSRSLLSPNVASASGSAPQTIAHTVAKGGRRSAHVPQLETLQRPTIAAEFGSKVPPNIRQRYLNSLIDECLKFQGEREAFNLGMAEERVCYERASSRMVYLNLAVNAVKRLRTQQEAGEAAQELLENDPTFKENASIEEPSTSEKPSTSGISSSPSKEVKPHPINPNHSRFSHFSVLAVGGQRGTWSIEKPKKSTVNVQNILKGTLFYKSLKKYVLTEKQLAENGYPSPDPEEKGKAILKAIDTRKKLSPSAVERYCDRCSVLYTVDKWGFPLSLGPCVHHWGRPYKRRGYSGLETRYSCCGGDLESDGCSQATTHVSQNYNPNELRGYVRTLPKYVKNNDYGVYALDCEMCYTTAGNELTRVTVIDSEGKTVYEQLVKPENPIIDYNTRFSGITESDMEDVKTTLRDVQASMLTRFCDKTILIGHSLESDFHALKLIHDTVVDTSVVFPHKMGAPFKRALKNLASEYLKKIIQNDVSGHDSAEDAITCMHLMKWRIKEDLKGFGKK